MKIGALKRYFVVSSIVSAAILVGCQQGGSHNSNVDVSEIDQTSVKEQVTGNCWAYALAGWIEAMHLQATQKQVDISESYMSYFQLYDHLLKVKGQKEVETGFHLSAAFHLILQYGIVTQQDFPASSEREQEAVDYLNSQLQQGGALFNANSRTSDNVIAQLNKAFGVDMKQVMAKAVPAAQFVIAGNDGKPVSLASALTQPGASWTENYFPRTGVARPESEGIDANTLNYVRRMQRAINDHKPLIINFYVIFDALEGTGDTFDYNRIPKTIPEGNAGGHAAIITDYVVDDVPGVGTIGEGEVSPELKEKALQGKVRYFKIKNSWGNKPTGPTSTRFDGYYKITLDYLIKPLPANKDGYRTALSSIIFPPGY